MLFLYPKNTTDFTNNGDPIHHSYDEHVIRDDGFYLTFSLLLDKEEGYKKVKKEMIVGADTPDGPNQFRVYDVKKKNTHVEVTAVQLMYDFDNKEVNPFSIKNATGNQVITKFKSSFKSSLGQFTMDSSVSELHDFATNEAEDDTPSHNALEILNRITSRWDSELMLNGFDIRMIKRLGQKTDALLYEKKNISEFEDSSSVSGMATRIHATSKFTPEGKENEVTLSVTVDSPLINEYAQIYEKSFVNNECRTEAELIAWAKLKYSTENIDKPSRSITVATNIIDGTEINYGDDLVLKYLVHDVDEVIRCVGYDYDPIRKTYYSVTLGDWKDSFLNTVTSNIVDSTNKQFNQLKNNITYVSMSANGKNRNAYGPEPVPNPINGDQWYYYELDRPNDVELRVYQDGFWVKFDFFATKNEVEGALTEAEEAKQEAIESYNNALADAATYTNTKAQEFDNQLLIVNQDLVIMKQSADSALIKADQAILDAGFAKVDAASAIDSAATALTKVDNLSTDVTNVRTDLNGNITALNQLKTDVDGYQITLADHTGKISTIQNNVNGLQTTVADKADKTQVTQLSNQWTQTTNLVNGHTSQISSLGTQINLKVTSAQVTEAILEDKTIKDTRHTNESPLWYIANYPKQKVEEFKYRGTIGVPGNSTFVKLTTDTPWSGTSGGVPVQTATSSDGTYQRKSNSSASTWLAWEKIIEAGELISQINIQSGNILIQTGKLYLDTTSTHMTIAYVNDLKAKSLEAVYADVATLKTKVLTADVITSTMVKSDTALITKLFATDANVNILTAKTAFINSIKAVTITADKVNGGTFNGANMNMINVNVSSLVGNISNFIQSNWNGLSSTVSITAAGMRGYSNTWGESLYQGGRLDFNILDPNDRSTYSVGLDPYKIQFSNSGWGKTNIRGQSEGLLIRPELTNTGSGLNSSIHLSGNITYLQFNDLGNNGVRGRIEVSANSTRFMSQNIVHFTEYNSPGIYQRTQALAYYTYDSVNTYNNMAIIGNRIQFVNENSNSNIYITPAVNGKLVVGKSSSAVWYNVECLTVTQKSTRRIKDNIIPLSNVGLDTVNALTVVEYDLKQNLARGVFEKQVGFIFEDSPSIANKEGESIDLGRVGAINTKAIQELSIFKDDHELRLKALEQENKELKAKIQQLESAA